MPKHTSPINLVVNCTARKACDLGQAVSLRDIAAGSIEKRAERWIKKLDRCPSTHVRAIDLYCGDSWSVLRDSANGAGTPQSVNLFIASAGYGLVGSEELLAPYSATFGRRQEDSVPPPGDCGDSTRVWWEALCNWRKAKRRKPVSVHGLAKEYPTRPLLLALSAEYVKAMEADLLAARDALRDPDLMVLVSVGAPKGGPLSASFLPCDARLEHILGGVRASLNARIVRHVFRQFSFDRIRMSYLRPRFQRLLRKQPEPRAFERERMDDAEVINFIEDAVSRFPESSHSALLRTLRDSGRACEQKRFRNIFQQLKD